MSSKRQAPELGDDVLPASQARPRKTPRLDTEEPPSNMNNLYFDFSGDQDILDDAVINELLANVDNPVDETPLSVLRDFQSVSSNTETFDPRLKFSPVKDGEEEALVPDNEPPSQNVNWDEVIELKEQTQTDTSPYASFAGPNTLHSSCMPQLVPSTAGTSSNTVDAAHTFSGMRLKPFKTFFHLSEMLEAKISTFKHSHNTVFELFARVIYSSRENFGHVQYFQFRDLFEESPPFLSGAISG